jgi:hypothetical protein
MILPPVLAKLWDELKGGQERHSIDLQHVLWGSEKGRWPVTHPTSDVRCNIARLNRKLAPFGYYITRSGKAGHAAIFRLTSIAPKLAGKPAWKQIDPEGIYIGS